ncbi:MAG: hypothetical protein ACI9NQ_001732 [Paracoccaceae bacterium]|jgi:hypothetical protein
MKHLPLLFLLFVLSSCNSSSPVSFSTPQLPPPGGFPNIFKKYSVSEDASMMDGWVRNFDMSGVSFDQRQTATLVTKRHVVMAKHYQRRPGSKVIFHSRTGKRLERILTEIRPVWGDIAVGLLNLDVPSGYKVYPLPAPREDYSHLVGRTAVITDQNRRVFFHKVSVVNPLYMSFRHEKPKRYGWGKNLIGGDSGNPSFLIAGGELVLVETHSSGGDGAGPFYGNPKVHEILQAAINELAPGYKLKMKNL